jgi:hypothetical protein
MDYDFAIKFHDCVPLLVKLQNGQLSRDYLALVYRNYQQQLPVLRDQGDYNIDKMRDLAAKAQDILGWSWTYDDYSDYAVTTKMHKDLERYLSKGFNVVPKEHDSLLHELHICLHSAQLGHQRTSVQLEWFNNDGFALQAYDFKFVHDNTLGAICLQNPHVGHPPDWIWRQNDHTAVWQTCKFHDFVRPGLVINMQGKLERTVGEFEHAETYLQWWRKWAPDFLEFHGQDKLLANTGRPVIGHILNNQDLLPLQLKNKLDFDSIEFHPDLISSLSFANLPSVYAISEFDYNNLAGPDWPAYQQFITGERRPDFVCQEIFDMTGIKIF